MSPPATTGELQIDLSKVTANWRTLDRLTAGSEVAAVLKADAYGLGATPIARALHAAGCQTFFVAEPGEGIALRDVVPDATIFVLTGATPGAEDDLVHHRLVPVLISGAQVERWGRHGRRLGRRLAAGLHLDTGMNRAGLDRPDTEDLGARSDLLEQIDCRLVMSHLASADEADTSQNDRQRRAFGTRRSLLPAGPASLANSAGIGLGPDYHLDLVRPGIALFGVDPSPSETLDVQRVVTLHAPVIQVRVADDGDTVGYGATHVIEGERRLATLAVGYADGFARSSSGRGSVSFEGHRAPIVGRVSMDLLTVDVTELPAGVTVEEGSVAELIGETIGVDEVAEAAGTVAYEILTNLGSRYRRQHVG